MEVAALDAPVEAERATGRVMQSLIPQDHAFASGRQAITHALAALGLGRADWVGIPAWSSHCLISAVAKVATPVPIAALMEGGRSPAAILHYEQWAWPSVPEALQEVRERWPQAKVLLDSVDSVDMSPSAEADAQVWSLSKSLGLAGGGLLCIGDSWATPPAAASTDPPADLADFPAGLSADLTEWILKDHRPQPQPRLLEQLSGLDLGRAMQNERSIRKERVKRVRHLMDPGIDLEGAAPTLAPIAAGLRRPMQERLANDLTALGHGLVNIYRFHASRHPLGSDYRPCVALPVHGRVTDAAFATMVSLAEDAIGGRS